MLSRLSKWGLNLYKVWIAALLVAFLAGCSLLPTRTVVLAPPGELLQACQEPQGDATTNGRMAIWLQGHQQALRACNLRLETAREWVRSTESLR